MPPRVFEMTFKEVSLFGFKCFEELQLPLAPLSLLTGYNTAGKSTSLQPLLLLSQTLRGSFYSNLLELNGPILRLGTAGEIVHKDIRSPIEFAVANEDKKIIWRFEPANMPGNQSLRLISCVFDGDEVNLNHSGIWPEYSKYFDDSLLKTIRDIVFLGPTRAPRGEVYSSPYHGVLIHGDVGSDGEFAPWWYAQLADEEIPENRCHPVEERKTLRGQVDAYLTDLFGEAYANASSIERTSLNRLEFRMGRDSNWLRSINTGYGLTYAFPLIVALLIAKEGQTVIVDSPEAHLHPRAQSEIGKILARFAAAGVQVITETHSDHVLAGVRLAVKDELIVPEDIALHFFGKLAHGEEVNVTSPNINENGSIDFWPAGFFDQTENDLGKLAGWT